MCRAFGTPDIWTFSAKVIKSCTSACGVSAGVELVQLAGHWPFQSACKGMKRLVLARKQQLFATNATDWTSQTRLNLAIPGLARTPISLLQSLRASKGSHSLSLAHLRWPFSASAQADRGGRGTRAKPSASANSRRTFHSGGRVHPGQPSTDAGDGTSSMVTHRPIANIHACATERS